MGQWAGAERPGKGQWAGAKRPGKRPSLAVWKFASCDGCQLTLLDCEDELLLLAEQIQIATFVEASSAIVAGPYDVSLVEGSITTPADERRIHQRFVSLDIDHVRDILQSTSHFRAAIRAAHVLGGCHRNLCAEIKRRFRNPDIVRGHDNAPNSFGPGGSLPHVLNQRFSTNRVQRFARKPGGSVSSGDNDGNISGHTGALG